MNGFLRYLSRIAQIGVAAALAGLGLVGEVARLISVDFPVPRWVDLILLMCGLVWGGYVVYRDKPLDESPLVSGATPLSRFSSTLSTLPRHLPMSEVVIGYSSKSDLRFTEAEFGAIDAWISSLNQESTPSRSDRSFIRRQVHLDHDLMWHVQVDLPGPVVSIDRVIEVHEIADGTAVDLGGLFDSWDVIRRELPRLSTTIGHAPVRLAVALQPYPSKRGPIIDLWFGELPQPHATGQAGNVVPWREVFEEPKDIATFPERAASSLLRHFGYQALEETLVAMGNLDQVEAKTTT